MLRSFGESLKTVAPGISSIGQAINEQFIQGSLGVTAIIAGGILLTVLGTKYIKKQLLEPALIEKRSSRGLIGLIKSFFKQPVQLKDPMVISTDLEEELNYIMATTKNIKKNGGEFEIFFYMGHLVLVKPYLLNY